jgi:hypothetical protein
MSSPPTARVRLSPRRATAVTAASTVYLRPKNVSVSARISAVSRLQFFNRSPPFDSFPAFAGVSKDKNRQNRKKHLIRAAVCDTLNQ